LGGLTKSLLLAKMIAEKLTNINKTDKKLKLTRLIIKTFYEAPKLIQIISLGY
jgi:hypothetical protein